MFTASIVLSFVAVALSLISIVSMIIFFYIIREDDQCEKYQNITLESEAMKRLHEYHLENEKYRSAINKILYILRDKQFSYKTEYNLSEDLDELFAILWLKYGSKDPDRQTPKPYKPISEVISEICKNSYNNPSESADNTGYRSS